MKSIFNSKTEQEKGQSLIILAFSFVGLVALMGLAIDLGMVYVERTALKRAIDAAVLAGVTELSNEEEAGIRALEYLNLNGYDMTDSNIYFQGCIADVEDWYAANGAWCGSAGCGDGDPTQIINVPGPDSGAAADWFYPYQITGDDAAVRNIFHVDTYQFQDTRACNNNPVALGDANKILITGTVKVDMSFFKLLGREDVNVGENAIAQNIDSLDIAVVIDRSGSMGYDPVCYGCWERTESPNVNDTPPYSDYYTYPENGQIFPLGLTDGFTNTNRIIACNNPHLGYDARDDLPGNLTGQAYHNAESEIDDMSYPEGSYQNIIIEAELYSLNPAPIDTALRETGKGYWALQRGSESGATSIDTRQAYMGHHPIRYTYSGSQYGEHYTLTDAQSGNAPWLEYDFQLPNGAGWSAGTATIWAKVTQGSNDNSGLGTGKAYWGLASTSTSFAVNYYPPAGNIQNTAEDTNSNDWQWIEVGDFSIDTSLNYRFYFFAGSTGYKVDRFIITDNPAEPNSTTKGAAATAGSAARVACDICNEVYAENIPGIDADTDGFLDACNFLQLTEAQNNALHPLWNDQVQPMRTTKEAVKFFATRLNPERDQIGLVTFAGSSATKDSELTCIKSATTQNIDCVTGSNPISFTTVLKELEDINASGTTPTWVGMRDGLEILGVDAPDTDCDGTADSSCSRGGSAQRVLILLTDGEPNTQGYGGGCTSSNSPEWPDDNNAYHRCPLYFADRAAQAGVTVYTIALGYGVNRDWLKAIADEGGGQAYFSASGGDLDIIFAQILSNIYVRLIQ